MNLIDYLVLIPLCWFAFWGFKKGLIYELTSVIALVLGFWMAYRFSDVVALWLPEMLFVKQVSFIIVFVAVLLLVHFAGRLATQMVKLAVPDVVDHIFGLLFGAGKVLLVFSVLFYVVEMVDPREIIIKPTAKENSVMYKYVEPIIPHAMKWKQEYNTGGQ